MTGKIGFFGGSFDPIHWGHLKMAKELADRHDLKEIWFCPAKISPHKLDNTPTAPIEHRLQMVTLACKEDPRFKLLDIEAKREGPSYTVDTIRELVKKESSKPNPQKIFLILSDEAIPGFFKWKDPEEIVNMVPLLIGSRLPTSEKSSEYTGSPRIIDAIKKGLSPTKPFNISSTEIRQRLKKGLDCEEFVPKKVLDYIYQNNLYC